MYNWMCFESRTDRKHRPRVELGVGWEVGQSVCVPVASRPRPPLPFLGALTLCPLQEPSRAFWNQPVIWETLLLGSFPSSLPTQTTPSPHPPHAPHCTPRALKPWRGRRKARVSELFKAGRGIMGGGAAPAGSLTVSLTPNLQWGAPS